MTVSSIATCPNPALLGPKLSPIEMSPIEWSTLSSMEISKPSLTDCIPSAMATAFIFAFSLGVVTVALLGDRNYYLANKISSIGFPPGSNGEFLRDVSACIIRNYGHFESLTSSLHHEAYVVLTHPQYQNMFNMRLPTEELLT